MGSNRFLRSHVYVLGTLPALVLGFVAWLFWPVIESRSTELTPEVTATDDRAKVDVATPVEGMPVSRTDLSLRAQATGRISAWRSVEISTEIAGKVARLGALESQRVTTGVELVRLHDQAHQIELAEAEADLLKARAQHAVSLVFEQRQQDQPDGRPQAEIPPEASESGLSDILEGRRRAEVRAAVSGLAQAEQRAARAQLALDRTRVLAPFDGRVAEVQAEIGQSLSAGQPCLLLLDDSRVKVEVDVLENDIVWLRQGVPADIRVPALDDRVFSGHVHSINPQIDAETGTGRVTVAITNADGRLMPGLFAFVELEIRRLPERLVVPTEALLTRQDRQLVFRLHEGHALWTYVTTGARAGGWVEITDGLGEHDVVAVSGHFSLAHEATVEITHRSAEHDERGQSSPAGADGDSKTSAAGP